MRIGWILIGGLFIFLLGMSIIYGATFYTDTPSSCPESDGTNFPGQDCNPNNICGDSGGIAQCYDTSTLVWGNLTSETVSSVSGSFDGGGLVNCYATADGSAPECSNGAGNTFWCDRASACYTTQRRFTDCTGFGVYECGSCRTDSGGFGDCDAGGDICEVQFGVTDYSSGINNHYDDCSTCGCDANWEICGGGNCATLPSCNYRANVACATNAVNGSGCAGCACSAGYSDCDSDLGSAPGGTGCEIRDFVTGCDVGSASGTYDDTCTCLVDNQDIATTGIPVNWSGTNPMLWFNFYSDTHTIWINHSTNNIFSVNGSGAYWNGFDLSTDTVGGAGGAGRAGDPPFLYNDSDTIYFNATLLNRTIDARENDTNAGTECVTGEYLDGDTSCYDFNTTVENAVQTITYLPTAIHTETGTLDDGNLASIQTLFDGDSYNVSEVTGVPGFLIYINFTGVVDFNEGIIREQYEGGSGHTVHIGVWNYNTGVWDEEWAEITDQDKFFMITGTVFGVTMVLLQLLQQTTTL